MPPFAASTTTIAGNDIVQATLNQRLLHLDKKRSQNILAGVPASNSRISIQEADFERNIQLFWDRVKRAESGMKDTPSALYSDELRKLLDEFGGFREP